jgi:hypothetical protein
MDVTLPFEVHLPRTKQLVEKCRNYCKDNAVLQKNFANQLGLSATAMNEIFQGRNNPSCEVGLHMLSILLESETMKSPLVDPPKFPKPSTRDPNEPLTLASAKEMLAARDADIAALRRAAASPGNLGSAPASPGRLQAAPPTRQGIVADRTPEQKLPEKLLLPASAITPFLADEIIKVTPTESLRRMLDSETISWRKAALYRAIKEREKLSTY